MYERATSSRSLKCDKCDGKYFSRSELVSHKIEAHGWKPEIRTYKCRNGCGKYFEESEKRVRHGDNTCEAREANVERLWQCEEVTCGKAFQFAHLLYLHRHAVHVRGAEVRGMLREIGINTMPLDGSTAVRAKFRANTRLYILELLRLNSRYSLAMSKVIRFTSVAPSKSAISHIEGHLPPQNLPD